jgi:hypothetical protein
MSIRETPWSPGTPSWTDLATPDQAAATGFYRALFGWEVSEGGTEYGGYGMASLEGRPVAGIAQQHPGTDSPPAWTTYLAVTDADATAEAITAHGGTVVLAPMQVGDQGRMAVAQDPAGAFFGIWEAGAHRGAEVVNQPGAVVWNECMTADPQAAREFYAAVFGYTYRSLEGAGDYTAIVGDGPGDTVGGIGAVSGDLPPHWMTYFMVDDPDAAASTAADHGGSVLAGPFDTSFGRIAVLRDPQGAVFSVMGGYTDDTGDAEDGTGGVEA